MVRALLMLGVVALAACESPWNVEMESPIRDIPEDYHRWFQEVGMCMGVPERATDARFAGIQWYSAIAIYNAQDDQHAVALWTEPHRITLRHDQAHDERVVKHELVHDFLSDGNHPAPYFKRCAGV